MAETLPEWAIRGELILNCNCTVFCPCVVSLGRHPPTEGYCQAWAGVRIDAGHHGGTDLSGLAVGLLMDIPGNMGRGNWKVGAYIDEAASAEAFEALVRIGGRLACSGCWWASSSAPNAPPCASRPRAGPAG